MPMRSTQLAKVLKGHGVTIAPAGRHFMTRRGEGRGYTIPAHNGMRTGVPDKYFEALCKHFGADVSETPIRSRPAISARFRVRHLTPPRAHGEAARLDDAEAGTRPGRAQHSQGLGLRLWGQGPRRDTSIGPGARWGAAAARTGEAMPGVVEEVRAAAAPAPAREAPTAPFAGPWTWS